MTENETILLAVAAQLETELASDLDGVALQVVPKRIYSPTPPCIDMYPGDPFQEQIAMGYQNREVFFTVRGRVSTADNEAGQSLLLHLLNVDGPGSVLAALASDPTFQGWVSDSMVDAVSGFAIHQDVRDAPELLGCTWHLRVVL